MHYTKILRNITGVSTPLFGIHWKPPPEQSDLAREIVGFLENRRVLYAPEEKEGAAYCRQSVERIRDFLTEKIPQLGNDEVQKLARAFRIQCRKFCDEIGSPGFPNLEGPVQKSILKTELEKLRLAAGKAVGALAVSYGVDVEDDLASIVPFREYR